MCLEQLERIAKKIRELERQAKTALYDQEDEATYRKLLFEKAEILVSLKELTKETGLSENISVKLLQFSWSAEQAIQLGSVFFMSALLYPDNYVEGLPNNLELVIEELKKN